MARQNLTRSPINIEDELKFVESQRIEFRLNLFEELEVYMPDGTLHTPVTPVRSFPVTDENRYISILRDDQKREEVCLIEDIEQLTDKNRGTLEQALAKVYFRPVITRLLSVNRQSGGISIWKVETDKGAITLDLKRRVSITDYGNGHLLITAIDGNRYEIPDYHEMDEKSLRLIMMQV
jgi:hypothetical protein